MAETPLQFICLDPRKDKRRAIDAMLRPLGHVRYLRVAPMGKGDFPETAARVAAAMEAAKRQPKTALADHAKRLLLRLQYNGTRRLFMRQPDTIAVAWNGLNGTRRVFMDAAKDAGVRQLHYELSPFKGRITADPFGVNYNNSLPRQAAPYMQWAATQERKIDWRDFAQSMTARKGAAPRETIGEAHSLDAPFVFIPLQVPGDSQLRIFGGQYRTVESVVERVAEAAKSLPQGWHARIKEHPTAPISIAAMFRKVAHEKVVLDNTTDTFALVSASKAVVTVNSSVGLEAMFFEKPVAALGQCFWAIPGIADHLPDAASLQRAFAAPKLLRFDPEARDAFLSFLLNSYYPLRDGSSDTVAKIKERLQGPDAFGFWADQHETAA